MNGQKTLIHSYRLLTSMTPTPTWTFGTTVKEESIRMISSMVRCQQERFIWNVSKWRKTSHFPRQESARKAEWKSNRRIPSPKSLISRDSSSTKVFGAITMPHASRCGSRTLRPKRKRNSWRKCIEWKVGCDRHWWLSHIAHQKTAEGNPGWLWEPVTCWATKVWLPCCAGRAIRSKRWNRFKTKIILTFTCD